MVGSLFWGTGNNGVVKDRAVLLTCIHCYYIIWTQPLKRLVPEGVVTAAVPIRCRIGLRDQKPRDLLRREPGRTAPYSPTAP